MDTLNPVEILKMGLPGLVLLLSVLSYWLLSKEQGKENPREVVLKSIKQFMYLNLVFAGLTVTAPLIEKKIMSSSEVIAPLDIPFDAVAMVGESLPIGSAAVCKSSINANKYVVVGNVGKPAEYFEVLARGVIPCDDNKQIAISAHEAEIKLKWPKEITQKDVRITAAPLGYKFNLPTL